MKRNYIAPCSRALQMQSNSMLAASIHMANPDTKIESESDYLSNRRQSIWDNGESESSKSPW